MNKIIEILINRDGMNEQEAIEYFNDVQEEAYELIEEGRLLNIEELILSDLGLEPDYIFDLINI